MEEVRSIFKFLTERVLWEGLGVDYTTFECILKKCVNTKNRINVTQDRDYWRALVNARLDFVV